MQEKDRMKKNIYKLFNLLLISHFFISCGSGGSTNDSSKIFYPDKSATNYFEYAWSVNENIDSTFKKRFSIVKNANIELSSAWNISKGKGVKVAIIDEDFQVNHPEIKDKIIATYNAMDGSNIVSNIGTQKFSHGTAVAGMIASKYFGIAPQVELILINLDLSDKDENGNITEGKATFLEVNNAFEFALKQGAQIINCSWGSKYIHPAIKAKLEDLKRKNINLVFASGNENLNLDQLGIFTEAELDSVIGVGSSTILNDVASYSNYGSNIDIIAPGGGGKSKNKDLLGVISLDKTGTKGINTSSDKYLTNNYTFVSGTSFAAPKVSGVIALLLSINPNLSPDKIRQILISTSDKIAKDKAHYNSMGFDKRRAYGKINANKAVEELMHIF